MDYQYSYLISSLMLLLFWIIFFLLEKDLRKPMLVFSFLFGIIGLPLEYTYLQDWWQVETITGTKIGIEDFITIFSFVGISIVCYKTIGRKRIFFSKNSLKYQRKRNFNFFYIVLGTLAISLISFYLLHIHSFFSNLIAALLPIGLLWWNRKDLIMNSLVSGLILTLISIVVYLAIDLITPGWIETVWLLDRISGIVIFRAPIEDLVWFFMVGVVFSSTYEWWRNGKLVSKSLKHT